MGSEFEISPLREASAFGAGIDRCVGIEIVAHKNGSQGENKFTAQLQILKILSRHGIRVDRRSTSHPDAQYTWRSSRKQLVFHAVAKIAASIDPNNFRRAGCIQLPCHSAHSPTPVRCSKNARLIYFRAGGG